MNGKRILFPLILFSNISFHAQSQAPADTIRTLSEVHVQGYPNQYNFLQTPASVGLLSNKELRNQPSFTIVPTLNVLPGVRMEERSPGSYRLAIRGSLLRSPFGIRNVKIYLDEFPLTDAGGNSYLQSLDAGSISSLEVWKGPHGSLFGANTGGVVRINPFAKPSDTSLVHARVTGGSFGLFQETVGFRKQWKNQRLELYQSYQKSDGYRQNSAMQRNYVQAAYSWNYSPYSRLKVLAFYSDLYYQTPGGLTLSQFNSHPDLARPTSGQLLGAVAQKAAVYNKTLFAGISNETHIQRNFRHVIALFGSHTNFRNPYITNYEVRNENTLGLRSYLEWTGNSGGAVEWKAHIGVEAQETFSTITDYGNYYGNPDTTQAANQVNARQWFAFAQYSATVWQRLVIEAGLSINSYSYQYKSIQYHPIPPFSTTTFNLQPLPRIAISYKILDQLAWRASASKGYSPPTIAELLPATNVISKNLQPEGGWNYETGLRYQGKRFTVDVAAFYYRLQNAIVTQQNAASIQYFVNAGGTNQLGLETQASYLLLPLRNNGVLRGAELTNSITYYHFKFANFTNAGVVNSGHNITGVPQAVVVSGLRLDFKHNIYFYAQHNYTSSIPLNDANTAYASYFNLVQLKAGWKISVTSRIKIEFTLGVDNLLNQKYSLGNDLNAVGGRYYNTAPPRNYYGGIGLFF